MSTITKEQAKDLRNAFQCWQQDYDPVEDKEQYDMFGLGMVAMDTLLASLEAEAAIHRWRRVTSEPYGPYPWHYGDFIGFSKPVDGIEDEYFYSAPPAPEKAEPVAWLWSHRKHPSEVSLVRPEDDERAEGAHWSGWSCQALYAAPPVPVSVPTFEEWCERTQQNPLGWVRDAMKEAYDGCCAAMLQCADSNSPVIPDDVRRMDWLVSKTVDVREPMVYGSHSLFWSQTITDEEDDYHATKLREQIDAAMAAEQAAAPQQEVKP